MATRVCPGLPADWLNAWLAAIGTTVLVPELKLSWSDDPVPMAVLTAPGDSDPVEVVAQALPTTDSVDECSLVRTSQGVADLPLNPTLDAWKQRVASFRSSPTAWMLSSLYTDLMWGRKSRDQRDQFVERGQFHTPMPGRDNTMYDRLRKLLPLIQPEDVALSLDGCARRSSNFGIGFDLGRIGSLADATENLVDPVVEVLAFFGLRQFPVRGNGGIHATQRGWSRRASRGPSFSWVAWPWPLSCRSIDALLDVAMCQNFSAVALGELRTWVTVAYLPRSTQDPTRAYGSAARA